jgi:hypothetical protein
VFRRYVVRRPVGKECSFMKPLPLGGGSGRRKKAAERGDSFNVTGRRGTINTISRTTGVGLKKEVTASLILLGKSHPGWAMGGHEQRPSSSGARKVESRDAWKGREKAPGLPLLLHT